MVSSVIININNKKKFKLKIMENKNGFCRTCSIETTIGMKDIFTEKYDYSEIIATLTNLTVNIFVKIFLKKT